MSAHGKFQDPIGILELGNTKEKNVAAARRASARVIGAFAGRGTGHGLPIFADLACDLETRLPRPARQWGMDPVRHDDHAPLPLADRSGAVPLPMQWTTDEGCLLAGRERGAGLA